MARGTAFALVGLVLLFAAASTEAARAASMIPITADQAKVMAMRPDPPKATKPDLASLSGAGRAYALPLEFIAHNNGGAHPAEKIGGLTSAAKLDLEGEILAKVNGYKKAASFN